ncbi:MAG: Yip1 family protein [Candidatus Hydrothermarchaeales archaeon]
MTAIENIKGVITAPKETFKNILKADHKLIIPLDIIIGVGILKGIANYLQKQKMLETISYLRSIMATQGLTTAQEQMLTHLASLQDVTFFDAVSYGVQSAIFGWLFLVVIYFIISRILSGKASLKDILEVTGYARVPEIIGAVVAIFLASFNPFLISFLLLAFILWARVLDILAIKEANDFSMRKAVGVVVIPLALYLFFTFIMFMAVGI